MPRFDPFPALRYDPAHCSPADVTAPPYDVLSADDRTELVGRSPHNAVLVDLPVAADGPDRYAEAGGRLRRWLAQGVLEQDPVASFTAYRMSVTDERGRTARTLGVLGALELSGPDEGRILPHEHTTPKARSDRLDLLRGARANTSAIWGLSLAPGLSATIDPGTDPDLVWTDPDGVTHEVWRILDPERIDAIAAAVASAPVVIADGHHRYETSLAYRDERRAAEGPGGPADATLAFVVELSPEQLAVRAIHRLVHGLDDVDLPAALAGGPGYREVGQVAADDVASGAVLDRMEEVGAVAVVHPDGHATLLAVEPAAFPADLDDLDSARLAHALEGIGPHELTYQHGADRAQEEVRSGRAGWAVLIRPVTVAAIAANAHEGRRMPPKSTFFHPKPATGIVFRLLDGP